MQGAVMSKLRAVADFCEEYTDEQQLDRLSAEDRRKQATFESIDYHKPFPTMYLRHLRLAYRSSRSRSGSNGPRRNSPDSLSRPAVADDTALSPYDASSRNSTVRWLLHLAIGVTVGVLATAIGISVAHLEDWRYNTLVSVVLGRTSRSVGLFVGLLFWLASGAGLVFAGTAFVQVLEPAAGGSGLPDVIAYLNGILMPKVLNIKTFTAKAVACVLSVAGGLPVGTEAPLIHLGAITGFGVTQGRSRTLGFQTALFQSFRNHKDRRDFVTAGAAAGVSAAFGAPIGGLLFVMEEVASFWDHSASGQIFLGTMIAFCTVAFINTFTESGSSGFVSNKAAILFEVNYSIPLNITAVIPAIFLGVFCGLLATLFTKLNLRVVRFRRRHFKPHFRRKLLEPMCIVVVFSLVCYLCALVGPCQPTIAAQPVNETTGLQPWHTENASRLVNFTCTGTGNYSPLATLMLSMGKANIRHLFTRRTADEFPAGVVFGYLLIYFVFAMYTSGTFISAGLVIPMLVIGATAGRLFGIGLVNVFALREIGGQNAYFVDHSWMDPGVFAVIGAGAFFGGVSRMTISLSVIMVELSGELHYLLPVMVAIIVAKATADLLCQPLYHALLHLDSVPYLPLDVPVDVEQFTAEDVMCSDVICLNIHEHAATVLHALQTSTHHAFPVVAKEQSVASGAMRKKFVGIVTREDIQLLLSHPLLSDRSADGDHDAAVPDEGDGESCRELPLSRRAEAVSRMTWVEWMRYQTSLFFIIGSTRWHEKWALVNAPETLPTRTAANTPIIAGDAGELHLLGDSAWSRDGVSGGGGGGGISTDDFLAAASTTRKSDDSKSASAASSPSAAASAGGGGADAHPRRLRVSPAPGDEHFQLDLSRLPPVIDLGLIVNRSPWVVPPFFNLNQTYTLFRQMGLRHLIVVDGERVVGVITRKDLLLPRLRELLRRGPSDIFDVPQGSSGGSFGHPTSRSRSPTTTTTTAPRVAGRPGTPGAPGGGESSATFRGAVAAMAPGITARARTDSTAKRDF